MKNQAENHIHRIGKQKYKPDDMGNDNTRDKRVPVIVLQYRHWMQGSGSFLKIKRIAQNASAATLL
jgi:hypothetical protein